MTDRRQNMLVIRRTARTLSGCCAYLNDWEHSICISWSFAPSKALSVLSFCMTLLLRLRIISPEAILPSLFNIYDQLCWLRSFTSVNKCKITDSNFQFSIFNNLTNEISNFYNLEIVFLILIIFLTFWNWKILFHKWCFSGTSNVFIRNYIIWWRAIMKNLQRLSALPEQLSTWHPKAMLNLKSGCHL